MINLLKILFKNPLRVLLKFFYGDELKSKPLRSTSMVIYYPPHQHLTFFGKHIVDYEREIMKYLKISTSVKEGDLVFDIGSNIGQYMLFFSDVVNTSGKVICFEPNPYSFKILCKNKIENKLDNVILVKAGIASVETKSLMLADDETGGRLSKLITSNEAKSHNAQEYFETDVYSLKSVIDKYGDPDFVKIDVEGGESDIFASVDLDHLPSKTKFIVEVRTETKECIFSFFKNYDCFCIETQSVINSSSDIPNFANLIFQNTKNNNLS